MGNLIYEDDPRVSASEYYRGTWLKYLAPSNTPAWPLYLLILLAEPFIVFTRSFGEQYLFIIIAILLVFITDLITRVKKYQIFNDKIRISSRCIHFDIPFSIIENTREAQIRDLFGLHLNFISLRPGDDVVQITRKRGWKVNIIPSSRRIFLENLNKAMNDYKGHYVSF